MVYGKDLFIGLFNNLALLIVFIAIYGYLYYKLRTQGWVRRQLINGLIFTVFVFGCMQVHIPVAEGVFVDQRNAIVILSGAYGGPLAAIISACFAAAYRIHLGGIGIYGGVLGVTLSMLAGIVIYRRRDSIDSVWKGMLVSFAATVFILPGFLPIKNLEHGWNLLKAMAIPYGTAVFLGLFLGGLLLYNEEKRCRTQEALRESADKYRDLFESLVDVSYRLNRDGVIEIISPSVVKMYGYTPEEMIGRTAASIFRDPAKFEVLRRRTAGEGYVENYEIECVHKDGSIVIVSTNAKKMVDREGGFAGIQGVSRDITQIRQTQEENRRLEENLRQSQKMESIGRLAGGIAHDFNNILAAILGYTEIVQSGMKDDDPVREDIDAIMKAGLRAKELIGHILLFSRKTLPNKVAVQINMIVKDALSLLRASTPSAIEIRPVIDISPAIILADPTAIHQVIMNLCTNAAHAIGNQGGVITVSLERVNSIPETAGNGSASVSGEYVALRVRDTGSGIDQADMPNIFDPYFTTKDTGQGTGLGLAVVHSIVRGHHGLITVESEKGKGTVFSVYLPEIHENADEPEENRTDLPSGNERVLLVDDEPPVVDVMKKRLEMLGYHVDSFNRSEEALDAFKSAPDRFDIVITDQTMPNINGKILAKRMREIRGDIPIILCTGYSSPVDTQRGDSDINEFVMKPLRIRDLAVIIRKVLDGRK